MAGLGSLGPYRAPAVTLTRRCSGPLSCVGWPAGRREPGGGRSIPRRPSRLVGPGFIGLAVVVRRAVGPVAVGPVERLLVARDGHQALPRGQVDQPDSHHLPAGQLDLGRKYYLKSRDLGSWVHLSVRGETVEFFRCFYGYDSCCHYCLRRGNSLEEHSTSREDPCRKVSRITM